MSTNAEKPASARGYRLKGKQQESLGEFEQAICSYYKAISLENPQPYWLYKHLRKLLIKQGEFSKASVISYDLAEIFLKERKISEALPCYQKSVELNPIFGDGCMGLGNVYRTKGKNGRAIDCYLQVTKTDPEYLVAYGAVSAIIKRYPLKSQQLEKIVRHHQNIAKSVEGETFIHVQLVLADALIKLGRIDEAIDCNKTIIKEKLQKSRPGFAKRHQVVEVPKKPDFIISGFAKCGTSSLYKYIVQHPNVMPTTRKEINFFNNDWLFNLGLNWYSSNFTPIPEGSDYMCGEATPVYAINSLARTRIQSLLPNIKIIILLRNPIDRAISQHYFGIKRGRAKDFKYYVSHGIDIIENIPDLREQLEQHDGCIPKAGDFSASLYVYYIEKWLELFPKENFLFLRTEDLGQNPADTVNSVFNFLKLPKRQLPEYPKRNVNNYKFVDNKLRSKLANFFHPHNVKLEQLIKMKLDWE